MQYCKIDLIHFLNLKFPTRICQKKALILDPEYFWEYRGQFSHRYKLTTVKEVIEYYKNTNNLEVQKNKMRENNWEYFNCLLYGFRKNVLDTDIHKTQGGPEITAKERNKILTPQYYENLEKMSDKDILEKTMDKLKVTDTQQEYEFNVGEYDSTIAFFVKRGFGRTAAEATAYVILQQAKIDEVSPQAILDKLTYANPAQLSELITVVLNENRYRSSRLGVRTTLTTKETVSRNILD